MNPDLRKSVIALSALIGIDLPIFQVARRCDAIIDAMPPGTVFTDELLRQIIKEAAKDLVREQLLDELAQREALKKLEEAADNQ